MATPVIPTSKPHVLPVAPHVAQVVPGGLTSVRQPLEEVAVEVVRALAGLLATPPAVGPGVLLRPSLAVRASS